MAANSGRTATLDAPAADAGARERLIGRIQRQGAFVVLLIVVVIGTFAFDRFLTFTNLQNIALQVSFLGLIVVGMTFVIISGGIDLSVGSLVALGGVLAAYGANAAWPLGLLAPLLICGAIGFLNGFLIGKARLAPFIVTLAGLLGFRGLALALSGEKNIAIDGSSPFVWFGRGDILGVPVPVVLAILAFVIGWLVLTRTRYGQAIFAIGGNEDSAKLMGVPVSRTKIIAYTVSGVLAGLAGALLAAQLSSGQPSAGQAWELDAISAVVVGGTLLTGGAGAIGGSLAGVLLLAILQNLINQVGTLGSYTQQLVSGLFLIVVVVVQTYLSKKRSS